MDMNKEFLTIINNKNYDKKDSIIILLLAQICTIHDPTPNTFLYTLYNLYKSNIITNLPNIDKINELSTIIVDKIYKCNNNLIMNILKN